jgi:hypothetical protein
MKNTQTFEEFVNESNEEVNEAMVQVAGKGKPAGAQILATVIIQLLQDKNAIGSGVNLKSLTEEIKTLIMDSTF